LSAHLLPDSIQRGIKHGSGREEEVVVVVEEEDGGRDRGKEREPPRNVNRRSDAAQSSQTDEWF